MRMEEDLPYLKERNQKDILKLFCPVIKALADLHSTGMVHGKIWTNSETYFKQPQFCFCLSQKQKEIFALMQKIIYYLNKVFGCYCCAGAIPLEQILSEKMSYESDVYSMCALIYKEITGMDPIDVQERIWEDKLIRPSILGVKISEKQEAILKKGLSILPKDRYSSASELYAELYVDDAGLNDVNFCHLKYFAKNQARNCFPHGGEYIEIPAIYTAIGSHAFSYLYNAQTKCIIIPNSVKEIQNYPFSDICVNDYIDVPGSVRKIGESYPFKLGKFGYVKCKPNSYIYKYCKKNNIPNSVDQK